jgi:hypothetical protein
MSELPLSLKKHLRQRVESELFAQHKQFIKCTNHLGETKWLTDTEIDEQHEFYPHQPGLLEKISKKDKTKKKPKIPKSAAVNKYIDELREEISTEIKSRIQKDQEKREQARLRRKANAEEKKSSERESSYSSHPDYKLYENHLGERRWLTDEEFENQDEFTLEVVPFSKNILTFAKWAVPILLVIIAATYYFTFDLVKPTIRGFVQVESNVSRGQLYIDHKLKLGLSLNEPIRLPEGTYHISYRKAGFVSSPPFHTLQISTSDTAQIFFSLSPIKGEDIAIINLRSTHDDAKVFVENNYYGLAKDNTKMILKPGKYEIALKKENYAAIPPSTEVTLSTGDSINLSFSFTDRSISRQRNGSDDEHGLIEVTSNLIGTKIFMDGKDTGYTTDHIFNKIPFGRHVISLQKDGYIIEPKEKSVRLTKLNAHQYAHFNLKRASLDVELKTAPVKGKIFLDGKELAIGNWQGGLAPGKYNLRFGNVDSYHTPNSVTIEVAEGKTNAYTFTYKPTFSLTFSPLGLLPKNATGNIQLGYVNEDDVFFSDPTNGPEIIKSEELAEKVWSLAYAFAYRNPPENDAIVFTFNVPSSIDLSQNLWLKMWGYKTEENYPMEFNDIQEIRISINNRMIQKDYTPRYSIDQASESKFERFRINNLLRPGTNRLQISTGPVNTTYFALWKISIE